METVVPGPARVHRLLEQAWVAEIGHIVSSDERKAVDTAELLVGHLGLSFTTRADLEENDRSATSYPPCPGSHRPLSTAV
jgi:broad specificity phosphatase PhoE